MSMSVEQFLSLSDAEQLQTIKDLNDIGQEEIIIDVLTGVGIDNLSVPLLGELGRAYNNNDKPEEAIKVLRPSIQNIEMQCGIIAVRTPMALLLLLIMRLIHQRTCNRC